MPAANRLAAGLLLPLGIAALALLLRLYGIDATSLWYDEGFSHGQASRSFFGMLYATGQDNYPPLHNAILYVTINLFGDSVTALRLPSAILGTATVFLLYRLGKDMFDRATGLVAAVLLCVSVTHIWYSIEARMYALLGFTAVLYVWMAFHAWTAPVSRRALILGVAGTVPLLYSHVFGAFLFIGINLAFALQAARSGPGVSAVVRQWFTGQAIAVAIYFPWSLNLLRRTQEADRSIGWIPDPSLSYVLDVTVQLLGGPVSAAAIGCVVLASAILILRGPHAAAAPQDGSSARARLLLACWILVPFGIMLVISLLFTSIIHHRYLIGQLPAICLAVALLVTRAFRNPVALIGAVAVLTLPTFLDPQRLAKPYWREQLAPAFDGFFKLVQPGDAVVLLPNGDPTFPYYVPDRSTLVMRAGEEALAELMDKNRLWVVSFREPQSEFAPVVTRLTDAGYSLTNLSDNPRITFFLFSRAEIAAPMEP